MRKPNPTSIQLSNVNYKYETRTTIKSQALSDFLADFNKSLELEAAMQKETIDRLEEQGQ